MARTKINVNEGGKVTIIENAVQVSRAPTETEILDGMEPDATVIGVVDAEGKVTWTGIESAPQPKPKGSAAHVFGKLTEGAIKTAIKGSANKGKVVSDGAGLYLRIFPAGARKPQWLYKYTANSGRKSITLGSYPAVSLDTARKLAQAERDRLATGHDPVAERHKAKVREAVPTFRQAAEAYYRENQHRWREGGEHRNRWLAVLAKHAFPVLGNMPVDQIETPDVLAVLTPEFWRDVPTEARRVRRRIRKVLDRSKALGHFKGDNPAGEVIDAVRHPNNSVATHIKALDPGDIAEALATVEESTSSEAVKLAFRFGVLCASRFIEIRHATWGEIDIEAARWRIPAGKMKMGEAHDIPLSDAALACLERAKALRTDQSPDALLFPSPRSGPDIARHHAERCWPRQGLRPIRTE